MYDSNNVIADAYGLPYLIESNTVVLEDVDTMIKRISVMNQRVINWIIENRRIPSSNPNANEDERNIAHWMRALEFYANIAVDHLDEHQDEMSSNDDVHKMCRYATKFGNVQEDS